MEINMRKLIVNTFVTLDGVMQAPGGPEEDPTGNFKFGGWSFNYWDEIMGNFMGEFMAKPFELLLGRKTYEIFAAHWPYMKDDPVANLFNNINKYVVSESLDKLNWNKSILIKNNVVNEIQNIKLTDGPELQVHGSAKLIKTLFKNNLVDRFNIWVFPLTIGYGKRLFGEGTIPSNFKLVDHKVSSTGVIITAYEPDGQIKMGSFALSNPSAAEIERRKKLREENSII
jgi:dihydrofolate reductase